MNGTETIWPSPERRLALQRLLSEKLDDFIREIQAGSPSTARSPEALRTELERIDFGDPVSEEHAVDLVLGLLGEANVHMMHPGYLGLFNPSVAFPGILADQINATINPQLAVWTHAPAAIEIERHTVSYIAGLLGWPNQLNCGHFTTGGAEANYTGFLTALTHISAQFADEGARVFAGQPSLYVSAESHLAWFKIAHQAGVGRQAVRLVPTDGTGRMDAAQLAIMIAGDLLNNRVPVMIAATAGTTNAGMIDPLTNCRDVADKFGLWLHVDAAWGGGAIFSEQASTALVGIDSADSITLDAHKWLAVPMGAGIFLCKDTALLSKTFRVQASYMPAATDATVDPYTHSMQWSRRFIGLKLFMCLAVMGHDGYRRHIDSALTLARRLATGLKADGWEVLNDSPLAVVCFYDRCGQTFLPDIARRITADGHYWLSTAMFEGQTVLRACITSHFTTAAHIDGLIVALSVARRRTAS